MLESEPWTWAQSMRRGYWEEQALWTRELMNKDSPSWEHCTPEREVKAGSPSMASGRDAGWPPRVGIVGPSPRALGEFRTQGRAWSRDAPQDIVT